MRLTNEQQEKAIGLRELLKNPRPENDVAWEGYIDFTRHLAQMLDGMDAFVPPSQMKNVFDRAWKSFAALWAKENERVILETMNGDEVLFNEVKGHANGRQILQRILERVKEQKGIAIGTVASDVDISDILSKEMSDDVGYS